MLFWLTLTLALAHKPTLDGPFDNADNAYLIADSNISIVVYQEITCEYPQLWMSFETAEEQELYIQLGVPVIDRLAEYRPNLAVVAHGLPEVANLPFSLPDGMGALVFSSEDESDDFYEPFTQTSSWIYIEETITLPQAGTGYLVAWSPENTTGKLWVSTGTVEDFSDVGIEDFVYWDEGVNNFHETGKHEIPYPTQELDCDDTPLEAVDEELPSAEAESSEKAQSCATASPAATLPLLLFALLGLRRRSEQPT